MSQTIRRLIHHITTHRDAIVGAFSIVCAVAGLAIGTGVIGPTIDYHAQDGRGSRYAAR